MKRSPLEEYQASTTLTYLGEIKDEESLYEIFAKNKETKNIKNNKPPINKKLFRNKKIVNTPPSGKSLFIERKTDKSDGFNTTNNNINNNNINNNNNSNSKDNENIVNKIRFYNKSQNTQHNTSTPTNNTPHNTPTTTVANLPNNTIKMLKYATLEGLVNNLTNNKGGIESCNFNILMTTYRTFTDAETLLKAIIKRYRSLKQEDVLCPRIRNNHLDSLKTIILQWITSYPEDFKPFIPQETYEKSQEKNKSSRQVSGGTFGMLKSFIDGDLEKGDKLGRLILHQMRAPQHNTHSEAAPSEDSALGSLCSEVHEEFAVCPSAVVAETLTSVDVALFQKLRIYECLDRIRTKRKQSTPTSSLSSSSSPSSSNNSTVKETIEQFNLIVNYVVSSILLASSSPSPSSTSTSTSSSSSSSSSSSDTQLRAFLIEKWIEIAQECRQLRSFSCLKAIITSLQSCAIYRLSSSWALVSREKMEMMKKLEECVSDDNNYHRLRSLMQGESVSKAPNELPSSPHPKPSSSSPSSSTQLTPELPLKSPSSCDMPYKKPNEKREESPSINNATQHVYSGNNDVDRNFFDSKQPGSIEGESLKAFSHYVDINNNDEDEDSNDDDYCVSNREIYKNSVKLYKLENRMNKIKRNKKNCKYNYKMLINDDEVVEAKPYKRDNEIYPPSERGTYNTNNDSRQQTSDTLNDDAALALQTDLQKTPEREEQLDVLSREESHLHSTPLTFSPDFSSLLSNSQHTFCPQSLPIHHPRDNSTPRKNSLATFPKTGNFTGTVPYLGIFFTDLTMLHSALPDFVHVKSSDGQSRDDETVSLEDKEAISKNNIMNQSSNGNDDFVNGVSKKCQKRFSQSYFDNEDTVNNSSKKWINFSKKRKEWQVLAKLQFFQTSLSHYNLYKSQHLLDLFNNLPLLDEKTSYDLSVKLETSSQTANTNVDRVSKKSKGNKKSPFLKTSPSLPSLITSSSPTYPYNSPPLKLSPNSFLSSSSFVPPLSSTFLRFKDKKKFFPHNQINRQSGVQLVSANLIKQIHNHTNTAKNHKFSSVGSYDNDESGFDDDDEDERDNNAFKRNILEQLHFNTDSDKNNLKRSENQYKAKVGAKGKASFRRSISLSKEHHGEKERDNVVAWRGGLLERIADKTEFNGRFEGREEHAQNIIVFSTKL